MLRLSKIVQRRLVAADGKRYETIAVGSVRRGETRPGDLDFIVVVPDRDIDKPSLLAGMRLRRSRSTSKSIQNISLAPVGPRSKITRTRHTFLQVGSLRVKVDLFLVAKSERPYALYHYTGPSAYNIRIRSHAKRNGWRLNQYGLFVAGADDRVPGTSRLRTERQLAEFLKVAYRTPEDRA